MRRKDLDRYEADPKMIVFQFESKIVRWWNNKP